MNFDKIELTSVAVRTTQYPTDNKPEFFNSNFIISADLSNIFFNCTSYLP